MPEFEFEGKRPQVHPDVWVAPIATLVGDVVVEAGASIWYGAVTRGDDSQVIVREGALVANGATVLDGARVGKRTVIAANALITAGAEIRDEVLVVRCSRT